MIGELSKALDVIIHPKSLKVRRQMWYEGGETLSGIIRHSTAVDLRYDCHRFLVPVPTGFHHRY